MAATSHNLSVISALANAMADTGNVTIPLQLSLQQQERFARHLLLPEVGTEGQLTLIRSRVLVVGAGGLGSAVLTYLAAAGVGMIGIVDDDRVDISNLQRQVIHCTEDIGRLKTESAAERLHAINPEVRTVQFSVRLDADNAEEILSDYDLIVDGTDNFATRYIINDLCLRLEIPYLWAAVSQFHATMSVMCTSHGPCLRCLHPQAPSPGAVPSSSEVGILGALPGIVGATEAVEALKLLLNLGKPLVGRLGIYDVLDGEWRYVTIVRNPQCIAPH